jgi:hypothetical protein
LPQLTSDDKHRLLLPVLMWPVGGKLYYGEPIDCEITRIPERYRGIVLEPGAEVARVYVRKTGPNPDLPMKAELTINPSLDGRITLAEWAEKATTSVWRLLLEFAPPPESVMELDIDFRSLFGG